MLKFEADPVVSDDWLPIDLIAMLKVLPEAAPMFNAPVVNKSQPVVPAAPLKSKI